MFQYVTAFRIQSLFSGHAPHHQFPEDERSAWRKCWELGVDNTFPRLPSPWRYAWTHFTHDHAKGEYVWGLRCPPRDCHLLRNTTDWWISAILDKDFEYGKQAPVYVT